MTGNSYVMDWEAIDDFIDESDLFTAYPHRYDPDDDEFHPHRPAAAHLCNASACTPRAVVTEFLSLDEFNDMLNSDPERYSDSDDPYLPELEFSEYAFWDLGTVNARIADAGIFTAPHRNDLVVVGYYLGTVEFIKL